ncbi:MAG: CYTH domain-containing protein [Sneathiella sp.]|nr:CYTH domain-containing protein [Sneathiella sp.]
MLEIEKKYLVQNESWRDQILDHKKIVQFYISPKDSIPTIRLRTKGNKGYITIKYPSVSANILARPEYEYEIPLSDVEAQKPSAIGRVIEKTRHKVRDEFGQIWDVDEFTSPSPGLVLAEIELTDEAEHVKLPAWAGSEVTADKRFSNQVMSYSEEMLFI